MFLCLYALIDKIVTIRVWWDGKEKNLSVWPEGSLHWCFFIATYSESFKAIKG